MPPTTIVQKKKKLGREKLGFFMAKKVEHELGYIRMCNRVHVWPFLLQKFELQLEFLQQLVQN